MNKALAIMTERYLKDMFEREAFRGEIKFNEPLSSHTSLRIGGPADVMLFPEDVVSLKEALAVAERERIPVFILGAGTNLLVRDGGLEGVVISLREFKGIEIVHDMESVLPGTPDMRHDEEITGTVSLHVEAGTPLSRLIDFTKKNGFSGIEPLAGIPGTFGGAVYMNAGSFGTEMKDVIISVAVMKMGGETVIVPREHIRFSYRRTHLPEDTIILGANIVLRRDTPSDVTARVREFMGKKARAQPLGKPSAGCVFKNPEGDSAGRLIDTAGCKGMGMGTVRVSSVHANYFISRKGSSSKDFIELMEKVMAKVHDVSGIVLEPEIKIVGREG